MFFGNAIAMLWSLSCAAAFAQPTSENLARVAPHTPVKNQANTGTCWSFSTISLVESQTMSLGMGEFDLSEMFVVRNIYREKARNYLLRQGKAQFGPGGLGHDVIHAIHAYGAVPESVYTGLLLGHNEHDHEAMDEKLKQYLDKVLETRPVSPDWMKGFEAILDDHLGKVPESFQWKEKTFTPKTFAAEVLKFNKDDYVCLTSFMHHPFYQAFILEVPDNYSNRAYYNLPLSEMVALVRDAIANGFSVMWDADVSNEHFRQKEGYAMLLTVGPGVVPNPEQEEVQVDQEMRQHLFEMLVTQDDHLMHLVGSEQTKGGKTFFLVKNSWGKRGPFDGYIKVSESYFALNTISLVVPRAAVPQALLSKLNAN